MTTKNNVSLVELFRGVPMLKEVMDILESKEFIEPNEPWPNEFTTIGVMSPLEKACFTFLEKNQSKNDILSKLDALGNCKIGGKIDVRCLVLVDEENDRCPFVDQLLEIQKMMETDAFAEQMNTLEFVRDFMFALVTSRMNATYSNLKGELYFKRNARIMTSMPMKSLETIEVFEFKDFNNTSANTMLDASLKGTFLESLPALFESGKFIEEGSSVAENEIIIRDMDDFEKALWMVYSSLFDEKISKKKEVEEFIKKSDAFVQLGSIISIGPGSVSGESIVIPRNDNHPDAIKVKQLKDEIKKMEETVDVLNTLFWSLVKADLPKEKCELYDATGIRKGFKVVMYNK